MERIIEGQQILVYGAQVAKTSTRLSRGDSVSLQVGDNVKIKKKFLSKDRQYLLGNHIVERTINGELSNIFLITSVRPCPEDRFISCTLTSDEDFNRVKSECSKCVISLDVDETRGQHWCTWWLEFVKKGRRRNRKTTTSRTGLRLPLRRELTSCIGK